ncbi:AAA family ATPase [Nonomuraea sp. MTCD27]|uniref:AAA family ATPase n=1 Tax=Nonomuraea sp. MTCD27 TaxID=1676747 RepID=UPI0035C111BB
MKLLRLVLQDFRQFLGTQDLEFAFDTQENVTVVYGATGTGKTTLLNALTWVLYNSFTPDFEQPERLVNDHFMASAPPGVERSASVTLEFEHERSRYLLQRRVTERQDHTGRRERVNNPEDDVSLTYTDEGGRNHVQRNPNDAIDRILPERLHQFFLFNGERIERLVDPNAYEKIEGAIKTLLGLEVVERAIRHLPEARRRLEQELRQVGTPEISRLTDEIDNLEARGEQLEEQLVTQRRNIAALDAELQEIDSKLRSLEEARLLQEDRDRADAAFQEAKTRLRSLRELIAETINDRGFLAFTESLTDQAAGMFGELRTKREIPTPMKRQFVEDLLESGECICGTQLLAGSEPHRYVTEWRRRVGLADVEEAWTRISAYADDFRHERDALARNLSHLTGELAVARADSDRYEQELSEISRKLERFGGEEVRAVEARRQKVNRDRDRVNQEIGGLSREIESVGRRCEECKGALKRAQVQSQRAEVAKRRVEVADGACQLFRQIRDLRAQDVREQLDARIREIYSAISYKPYRPELSEDFRLTLRGSDGILPVAKSTGENQILSLSFVGALAALARERHDEAAQATGSALLKITGGVFPIVMDAPFGTLDETPRREVAGGLPLLAPQVVIFVSKAQGLGPAEEVLRPRTGRSWVIRYMTPKADVSPETIELPSGSYPYVDLASDGVECAKLLEA